MRLSQAELSRPYGRVRISEQAPRNRLHVLERNNCLAEVVERGGGVVVERHRVTQPHPEREVMTLTEDASRHGYRFALHCLGFFEAL